MTPPKFENIFSKKRNLECLEQGIIQCSTSKIGRMSQNLGKMGREFECSICFCLMDTNILRPRILSCGHTLCTRCLSGILESSKACPTCKKSMPREQVEEYPTNYMILEIISNNQKLRARPTNQILKSYKKIKDKCKDIAPLVQSLMDEVELGDRCQKQIVALIEDNDGPLDAEELKNKIKELDGIMDGIHSRVAPSYSSVISDVSFRCEDFNSVSHLIAEIQKGIQIKSQKFAAVLKIDGVKKFAKISISENYLFIHAFEDSYEKDIFTFNFQNLLDMLLRSVPEIRVQGFLDLSYQIDVPIRKVIIRIKDFTSPLSYRFLKLCSGEHGVSYKGREYVQRHDHLDLNYIIRIEDIGCHFKGIDSFSKHFLRQDCIGKEYHHSYYLTCDSDGSLDIIDRDHGLNMPLINNVVGPVVDFHGDMAYTFRDATERKVVDCGLAFKF